MDIMSLKGRHIRIGTVVLLLMLGVQIQLFAQQVDKRISLAVTNKPMAEVLKKIESTSGERINFNYEDVYAYRVSCNVRNETVGNILKQILQGKPLQYKREGAFYIIFLKPQSAEAKDKAKLCEVRGRIYDEKGEPLAGAVVAVDGTTTGTSANMDGEFSILVDNGESHTLRVSYLGMETTKMKVSIPSGRSKYDLNNIVLKENSNLLSEVVVTGYQTMSRREAASAVSSVKAEDIMVQGLTSIDQMLQGTMPGLSVINTSGEPSATPKIRIRGNATINGNKSPVWVVDGVILEQDVPFTASDINSEDAEYLIGNAISGVNPQDIETITVLKDASATAIYGVKAANGVIVVTTKKGKTGKPAITYNGNLTISSRPSYSDYDLMNSQQRVNFSKQLVDAGYTFGRTPSGTTTYEGAYEALMNKQLTLDEFRSTVDELQTRNTDWFDYLFRNSVTHTHSLNVSGGTDKVTYYVSAGYQNIQGSAKGSETEKFNTLAKITMRVNKHITAMAKVDYTNTANAGYHSSINPFNYAYKRTRTMPAYNEDGSYYMSYEKSGILGTSNIGYNVLKELDNTGRSSQMDDFNALLQLDINIWRGLKYTGTFSYHNSNTQQRSWATEQSYYISNIRGWDYGKYTAYDSQYMDSELPYGGILDQSTTRKTGYTIRNQASWQETFATDHYVSVMAGIEARRNAYKGMSVTGYGWTPEFGEKFNPVMTDDYIENYVKKGYDLPTNTNSFTQVASFYGVASYSYADRYVLNANIRSDGSNKFGSNPKYRWLPTYSLALKWNIMNEKFMKDATWVDELAIRGSYGLQGNIHEDSSPYLIVTTGNRDKVTNLPTSTIYRLPNPDLRWEKTHSWNAALDFSLFDHRLQGGIDVYGKHTSDLIISKTVASSNGRTSLYYNAGKMQNNGVEGFVNATVIRKKDWTWKVGVNFSRNVNEITYANEEDLNATEIVDQMLSGTLAIAGAPIGSLYAYEFAGINEETGYPMFYTKDGKPSITGNKVDMKLVRCGSIFPKLTGGFDTQLRYKDFALSMNFTYSIGSVSRLPNYYADGNSYIDPLSNLSTEWLNCWKQAGDVTIYPAAYNATMAENYLAAHPEYNTYDETKGGHVYAYYMYNYSDIRVASADFLKLKLVSLSYNLPKKLIRPLSINSLMLRFQATNLFTIADKKWHGLDPETNGANIPSLPTFSLGVNVSF